MYPFYKDFTARQKNISSGVNTCEYIVLHHTGTQEGTVEGNIKTLLGETSRQVSCHFLIDETGKSYKLADPKSITWHAGTSEWEGKQNLNQYSLGIEVIGPLKDGGFTDAQRFEIKRLCEHLMAVFNIPNTKIIRHKDISPGRKTDIADSLWNKKFKTFFEYKTRFEPKQQ